MHRILIVSRSSEDCYIIAFHFFNTSGFVTAGNEGDAGEPGEACGKCHGASVVAAGCNGYPAVSPAHRIPDMGKGNSVLLCARRVSTLKFQIKLADSELPFDIAGTKQEGVADF